MRYVSLLRGLSGAKLQHLPPSLAAIDVPECEAVKLFSRRRCCAAAVLSSMLAVAAATMAVRYGMLENGFLPRDCSAIDAPQALCAFKTVLLQTFMQQRIGWASLVCAVPAFLLSSRRLAWAGGLFGVAGLVLYSYEPAAVGGLLSVLVLLRPSEQRRRRKYQADEQPTDGLRVGGLE